MSTRRRREGASPAEDALRYLGRGNIERQNRSQQGQVPHGQWRESQDGRDRCVGQREGCRDDEHGRCRQVSARPANEERLPRPNHQHDKPCRDDRFQEPADPESIDRCPEQEKHAEGRVVEHGTDQAGRHLGPRKSAHREGNTFKVLPLRMESDLVDKFDEARKRRGLHSRMDLFRKSLHGFLESAGENDVAAQLATAEA